MDCAAGIPGLWGEVPVSASCPGTLLHLPTFRALDQGMVKLQDRQTQSDHPNDNSAGGHFSQASKSTGTSCPRPPHTHTVTQPQWWLLVRYPSTHLGYLIPSAPPRNTSEASSTAHVPRDATATVMGFPHTPCSAHFAGLLALSFVGCGVASGSAGEPHRSLSYL